MGAIESVLSNVLTYLTPCTTSLDSFGKQAQIVYGILLHDQAILLDQTPHPVSFPFQSLSFNYSSHQCNLIIQLTNLWVTLGGSRKSVTEFQKLDNVLSDLLTSKHVAKEQVT